MDHVQNGFGPWAFDPDSSSPPHTTSRTTMENVFPRACALPDSAAHPPASSAGASGSGTVASLPAYASPSGARASPHYVCDSVTRQEPHAGTRERPSFSPHSALSSPDDMAVTFSSLRARSASDEYNDGDRDGDDRRVPGSSVRLKRERERKHGCWMCHKSFDRPSTLKKHMLVHTGEKAHVCPTCSRRFSVSSNLNRHAKRCAERMAMNTNPKPQIPPRSPGLHAEMELPPSAPIPRPALRIDIPSERKRRRRAPSLGEWVPPSLRTFDLHPAELDKSTPVPLPPVQPTRASSSSCSSSDEDEERDSFVDLTTEDEPNVSRRPGLYHPDGWRGRLPGPGFGHGFGVGLGARASGSDGKHCVVGRLVLF